MNKYFKNFIIFSTGAAIGFDICGAIVVKIAIDRGYLQDFVLKKIRKLCDKEPSANVWKTEFIFDSRSSAEKVLEELDEYMKLYGTVSIADVYDLVGETSPYTANNYGWKNLNTASIVRVYNGYRLRLPSPIRIDNL